MPEDFSVKKDSQKNNQLLLLWTIPLPAPATLTNHTLSAVSHCFPVIVGPLPLKP
jgi:hypothetical protein